MKFLEPTKLKNHAYVAGPMTNLPNFNFGAFDAVSMKCRRDDGWAVFNPHEHDQERYPGVDDAAATKIGDVAAAAEEVGFNFQDAMTWDLQAVAVAEHLVMLPGWEGSTGAKAERFVGEMTGSTIWLAYHSQGVGWYLVLDPRQKRLQGPVLTGEGTVSVVPQMGPQTVHGEGGRVPALTKGEWIREIEVIPYKPETTVIGLMGYAQVGKDTLAGQLVEHHGFTRIAFADTLRECLYALNPDVTLEKGQQCIDGFRVDNIVTIQELVDKVGWDLAKQEPAVRGLLQRLGTEVGREILGNDIWVETALKKVQPGGKYVITDMRFPNELAAVTTLGGKTVRILREGYGPVNDHWSETALDGFTSDVTIWNSGTPEHLANGVRLALASATRMATA